VAGIAMGLIAEGDRFVTLTDILGAEDALGDMDFKVAGTKDFITALQLDTKVTGLPAEVLSGALKQAREARLFILDRMLETIPEPRPMLSAKAPKVETIQIPVDKIGEVIGPKGKRINEIIAETGADVDIHDDGTVFIGSKEGDGAERAKEMINAIVNPVMPEVGEVFEGKVVKTTTFGAFVNVTPAKDGLVHISKLGRGGKRVATVEDVVNVGETLTVRVREVDQQGRISLEPVWGDEDEGDGGGEPEDRGSEASSDREERQEERPSGDREREGGGERRRRRRRRPGDGARRE
jgi:polyribonucleotide nucleotidyltransferase